jgi:serine/threonine protein kinase
LPVIPGYRVVGRLGEGGMGEVYEVVDEKVAVRLALKMVRPDRVGADFLARFHQEIRAMMLLDHPNIARIYGHGEVDDIPFFTMEFFSGGDLAARRDEFGADARKAVEVTAKVAAAVQYLHEQGKVHRDLKLLNILLDESGEPHLSDFGLVKECAALAPVDGPSAREEARRGPGPAAPDAETKPGSAAPTGDAALTRPGDVMGTYAYMSPEQTRGGAGAVGLHSDVWALGVILYELLAGRKPFVAADTVELVRQINEVSPPPPSSFRERPEPELDAIVLKCLAKDAAARYESVDAFAAAIRGWLTKKARPKRWRWLDWGLAGAAVVCLALLAMALVPRPKPQPPQQTPEQWLEEAQKKLADGQEVEWVGEGGRPRWFKIRAGQEAAFVRPLEGDNTFTVDTNSIALIELCPAPKCDRYSVEAEVRQNNSDKLNSRVGLYFMHQARGADQRGHSFAHWFFTEDLKPGAWLKAPPPDRRAGRAEFLVTVFRAEPNQAYAPQTAGGVKTAEFTEPKAKERFGWRNLGIDVGPTGVTLRFDGQIITTVKPARLTQFAQSFDLPGGEAVSLDPRGGVGFYVSASSASFRNVVVRPRPAE